MICRLKLYPAIVVVGCMTVLIACDMKAGISLYKSREPTVAEIGQQNQTISSTKQDDEGIAKLLKSESGGMLTIRTSPSERRAITPAYLRGDFNGDGAVDLAIIAFLNVKVDFDPQPLTTFVIDKAYPPNYRATYKFTPQNLKGYRDSGLPLLVVFHGATDTNVVDFKIKERFIILSGIDNYSKKALLFRGALKPAVAGDEPRVIPPPKLVGDAIVILDDQNTGNAIFWYGGRYCYYPVENFKASSRSAR